jgi:hypothetical protein
VGAGERASLLPQAAATFFSTLVVASRNLSPPVGAHAPILPRPCLTTPHWLCSSSGHRTPTPIEEYCRLPAKKEQKRKEEYCRWPPLKSLAVVELPAPPLFPNAGARPAVLSPWEIALHPCAQPGHREAEAAGSGAETELEWTGDGERGELKKDGISR